ncbi:uncharacterized protein LOC142322845 isoform X3 [Lycorma delicatula]|uniref:uncharacterized protein LOC142322845 isoform X3 n=1 Tax=Lycorma delicatula TaxID=130591 RepID=UPI003F50F3CE
MHHISTRNEGLSVCGKLFCEVIAFTLLEIHTKMLPVPVRCFNYKECCFGLICEPTKRNTSIAYCKFPVGPIIQEVGNFLVFREMLKGGLLLFNALAY